MFRDRQEAGQKLGVELEKLGLHQPVVLAMPRGGVPVAVEVAKVLKAPLDLVVVRKIGAPGNPELAVAAIVDGNPPDIVLNREIVEAYMLDDDELRVLIAKERPELERRRLAYRGKRPPLSIAGKTAIIVDDGIATGTTMKVAIRALKRRSPGEIVVAVPVAPPDTLAELAREADRVVCLSQPAGFHALGYHYRSFPQLTDDEVTGALAEIRQERRAGQRTVRRRTTTPRVA
ncbi:phosphoribosyltransferase [Mesorhizobium sp.]|uniref:phosphoribosyltransferase n=1 Tax=Mesorhizobium sp. TaxID=1871066 RepID=UPI0012296CCB|nr:phosphoribosyltransferase [Mesorhizobium sp.]TIO05583.1 MAG: phosphoribosyltransferase [Mesorhizobium sp.]TIO29466.1 MAG: phosphoribosyltransferase [Mesorhizobium sp.]TIP08820.1 MAG: phosphoribosyltransferase [Mesorhizobium sp.]